MPFHFLFLPERCLWDTEAQNLTRVSEFHFTGLSDDPKLKNMLFGFFLFMYLVTVLGNLLIILLVSCDSHLHTPMYFFLSNLAFADIGFISSTVPRLIADIQTHDHGISYVNCLTQMSVFTFFAGMDDMLLTVMAYDRFVAICHPLHYHVIMNPHQCVLLVLLSWVLSLVDSQIHNLYILQFIYFKSVEISNFFCYPSHLLHLVCSDTLSNRIVKYLVGAMFGFLPLSGILFSYYKIILNIIKITSKGGRSKAFSTCGSHLTVVCFFYVTIIGVYLGADVAGSTTTVLVASIIYTVVTPMLNPFIYSLRNRDIHSALSRMHRRIIIQNRSQPV